MKSIPLFIALKYFRSKRAGFLSFVSSMAFSSLALGVAILILVSSVMNGFERELRDRILQSIPHASINGNINTNNLKVIQSLLTQNEEVIASAPYIETQGLLISKDSLKGVYICGISPNDEPGVSLVSKRIIQGNFQALSPEDYGIIIGDILSYQLGLNVGDFVNILVPETSLGLAGIFPKTKKFKVVGIFNIGSPEIDQSHVYIHIKNASKLLRMGNKFHGVRIRYKDLFKAKVNVEADKDRLNKTIFSNLESSDWTYSYGTLFEAILMEKFLVSLLLSAIVLVAVVNVVTMLTMTINEKRSQIAIMMTIGGTRSFIQKIFLLFGSLVALAGTSIGLIIGLLVTLNLSDIIEFIEINLGLSLLDAYFIDYFPIDIRPYWVSVICGGSILLTLIASLYPARLASSLEPAEVLKYE